MLTYLSRKPFKSITLRLRLGNPAHQIAELEKVGENMAVVDENLGISLHNALGVALAALKNIPPYGTREVLVVMGSLATYDAGGACGSCGSGACGMVHANGTSFTCPRWKS